MARTVKQFRYYGSNNKSNNQPEGITTGALASGGIFFDSNEGVQSIVQLGIQTIPGMKFYINDGLEPIIVGSTGIYELDLSGLTDITSLNFDRTSLQRISDINGAYLIVDAIYETEEE